MRRSGIISILIVLFAALDIFMALFSLIYLTSASKKIQSLELVPQFTEKDLDLDTDYEFEAVVTPSRAKLKKVKAQCDDPNSTIKMDKKGKITLHTSAQEGQVTVYLEYKKIKSQVLTYEICDLKVKLAEEAAAQEAAEAAAEAERIAAEKKKLEEEEAARTWVKMIADDVNIRASNSTDSESLGKAMLDDVFEKVEYVEDWTHIKYRGADGYIKSQFLTEISRAEAMGEVGGTAEITIDNIDEQDEGETVNLVEGTQGGYSAEQQAAIEAAMNAAKDKKQNEADAAAQQAEAELAAQQAEAEAAAQAAAAAAAAAGPSIDCADGPHTFTQQQYNFLKGFWYREGQTSEDDWKVYAHKHTYAEIIQICQIEGGIY